MKKILAVIMCVMLLVTFAACTSAGFMSASKVNRVVKEFGVPQAELTLNFTSNRKKMTYVITYDLLLDKAPITTINFINLVNDGFYNDAIFDRYDSSSNYYLGGRYAYRKAEESSSAKGYKNESGITIKGEFKTNLYPEPKSGYAQFSMCSLAMYHGTSEDDFNAANGTLIFSTSESKSLKATNYAVFAAMSSIAIYADGELINKYDNMPSTYHAQMTTLTTTTKCSMLNDNGDTESIDVLGAGGVPRFIFSIKMLGDSDWSKLPKVN